MPFNRRDLFKGMIAGWLSTRSPTTAAAASEGTPALSSLSKLMDQYCSSSDRLTGLSEQLFALYDSPLAQSHGYEFGSRLHRDRDQKLYEQIEPMLTSIFEEGAKQFELAVRFRNEASRPGPAADLLALEKKRLKSLLHASASIRSKEKQKGDISPYGYVQDDHASQRVLNGEYPEAVEHMRSLNRWFESFTEFDKLNPSVRDAIKAAYARIEHAYGAERDEVLRRSGISREAWDTLFRKTIQDTTGGDLAQRNAVERPFGDMYGWRTLQLSDSDAPERVLERVYGIADHVRSDSIRYIKDEKYTDRSGAEIPGIRKRLEQLTTRLYGQYPQLDPENFDVLSEILTRQFDRSPGYENTYRHLRTASPSKVRAPSGKKTLPPSAETQRLPQAAFEALPEAQPASHPSEALPQAQPKKRDVNLSAPEENAKGLGKTRRIDMMGPIRNILTRMYTEEETGRGNVLPKKATAGLVLPKKEIPQENPTLPLGEPENPPPAPEAQRPGALSAEVISRREKNELGPPGQESGQITR